MQEEIKKLYTILESFLGESKTGYCDGQFQYEFPCPCCVDKYGNGEVRKHNLSISLSKQQMNCWRCSSEGENMHGSIIKLIRMYGNDTLLNEYRETIRSIHESDLYKLHFDNNDFNIDTSIITREELKLPSSYKLFNRDEKAHYGALKYVKERGLTWDILEKYKIGYTTREEDEKMRKYSYRIILPSYDKFGELNYWVGRNYLPEDERFPRTKYSNPKAEKKDIIFNEERVQWDADITLVEGAFDHIVVPNSIPLLGKALDTDYKLYWELVTRSNANINVFLDADAFQTVKEIYKLLNHGRLYNKIRYIPIEEGEDPSSLYQKGGYKKIAEHLANAQQIKDIFLF